MEIYPMDFFYGMKKYQFKILAAEGAIAYKTIRNYTVEITDLFHCDLKLQNLKTSNNATFHY